MIRKTTVAMAAAAVLALTFVPVASAAACGIPQAYPGCADAGAATAPVATRAHRE
ncbi:hypothetical protein ABZX92_37485 [Lentzea sp. NPDC006480]|uniref:hypothetical protein n=1 Tax=Lentzea sp. NPDC006480 TaxID=3157176 RepID=UPI0033B21F75